MTPPHHRSESDPRAFGFAAVMLCVLLATISVFIVFAPNTVPGHIGSNGTIGSWSSKALVLTAVIPVSLLISVGFMIRPLWESLPLSLVQMPFVFFKSFWIAEGRTDYVYARMLEFLRILSGLCSGFFTALLWMDLWAAAGLPVPAHLQQFVFVSLAAALIAAVVRNYRSLHPSQWTPESD